MIAGAFQAFERLGEFSLRQRRVNCGMNSDFGREMCKKREGKGREKEGKGRAE